MVILLNILHILYHVCLAFAGGMLGAKIVHKKLTEEEKKK